MIRLAWISKKILSMKVKEDFKKTTVSLDISLDGYTGKDDGGAQPLRGGEFVVVDDDGEKHGEQFACEGDGDEG